MSRSGAGRPRRVWYWRQASQTALAAVPLALLAFMTITIAGAFGSVHIGLILGGVEVLLGGALIAATSPAIMLGTDAIRIWHGLKFINIGVSEIAGVGMLYSHTAGYGGSWRLSIWRDDDSCEATGYTYLLGRAPRLAPGKGERWVRQATYDPVAASEIPALNASRAATVGKDVCQRILAIQGPDGELATRHLEKHQRPVRLTPYTQVIAYWSPDGQTGHCR
jgi:hypothetical protein